MARVQADPSDHVVLEAQMIADLRYLKIVLKHKWFVFVSGFKIGVPLKQLLLHDMSKFSRAEWGPYKRRFATGRAGRLDHSQEPLEWKRAWAHHWTNNPHHWEFWLLEGYPQRMPENYMREMVADWMGAGRGYTGSWDIEAWYFRNRDRINIHPDTSRQVELLIGFPCTNPGLTPGQIKTLRSAA
jgi:hypothetical protein